MTAPPPYPRMAHLVGNRGSRDDVVLDADQVAALRGRPVVVEEKLDGANVVVWRDGEGMECALRAGPGAMDRAGQLGPLRAWLAHHEEVVRPLLTGDGATLYAEWLLLTHTVAYDRLPSYLIALDLWRADRGFATVDERDAACGAAGLATAPELWRGVDDRPDALEGLLGTSAWGSQPMEGLVVRTLDGRAPRIAKLVRGAFDRLDDAGWRRGRPRNLLAHREASWR